MFSDYVAKAMHMATYEWLEEDKQFVGTIPGFAGLLGHAPTLEACREDLKGALEDWLVFKLWDNDDDIPVLGKLSLAPRRVKVRTNNGSALPTGSRKAS